MTSLIRRMAAVVGSGALAVALLAVPAAQTRPDFSGTWVVEQVEVQAPARPARGADGDRGGFPGGGRGRPAGRAGQGRGGLAGVQYRTGDRVTVKQTDDALIVTDARRGLMSSYPFDGREMRNPGPGDSTITSKTKWEGAALVIESEPSIAGARGGRSITIREVRSLSEDGRTMTVVSSSRTPFGTVSSTVTFARADQPR